MMWVSTRLSSIFGILLVWRFGENLSDDPSDWGENPNGRSPAAIEAMEDRPGSEAGQKDLTLRFQFLLRADSVV